jgi:hypothetical protein
VPDAKQELKAVVVPCTEDCTAKNTACATYQCDAAASKCVVSKLNSGGVQVRHVSSSVERL